MSKNITPQWGDKPIQTPVWIWNTQKVIAISADKVDGILNFMAEKEIPLRDLAEHLECLNLDNIPGVIAQIKWSDNYILNNLKENFLNHKTTKLANELIELTKTMTPKDALLKLYWWYKNSKWEINYMFDQSMITPAKLMIEESKDMKLDDAVELLWFWIVHSSSKIQKIFQETAVDLVKKLEPKEAIKILDRLTTYSNSENRKILEKAIIFHSKLFTQSAQKLENPKDILEALDGIFYYSDEKKAQEVFEEAMISPAKEFIESTKNMSQKWFWETLKWRKKNYIRNSIKIWFDIMTGTKRTKDIIETLEEGLSFTRWEARNILVTEIINFVIENYEPQEALKILKQKKKLFLSYGREISANVIIKLAKDNLNQEEILKTLNWWFENSKKSNTWDNLKIYANAIADFAIKNLEPKKALEVIYFGWSIYRYDNIWKIFEKAMIEPAKLFVESTKNMPQKEALKVLKWWRNHSIGEACVLIKDEIRYRSNLWELSQLIKN